MLDLEANQELEVQFGIRAGLSTACCSHLSRAEEINSRSLRTREGLVTPQLRLAAAHRLRAQSLCGRRMVAEEAARGRANEARGRAGEGAGRYEEARGNAKGDDGAARAEDAQGL